nr:hypothetical protein [Tanacetum cinerariifolium]
MVDDNVRNQMRQNAVQSSSIQIVKNMNGLSVVSEIANQYGNGNVVTALPEGIVDLDEIEEVNANCILMANLQQASTSGTQTNKASVYDSDESTEVNKARADMSLASSAVTYTSVYTDSKSGRVSWGADEELSDGGSPRVIVYVYDGLPMPPVAPPSPDYIPGPEEPQTPLAPLDEDEHELVFIQPHDLDFMPEPIYPEYIPLEAEHILLAKEQPLPPIVSPTAESPGYVVESDPEEDPEEYEEDEIEDGLVGYPMDGGDDGDDNDGDSSGYDADDKDEDEEEEEEEHLALADFAPPRKRICLSTLSSRQIMAPVTRQGHNPPPPNTDTLPYHMTLESVQAMIDQALLRNSTNGDGSQSSHEDNPRHVQTTRPCFYADFMKCHPLNFMGNEGVVGLTRWIEKMESIFNISCCVIENQVKFTTCTLLDAALTWWNSQTRTLGPKAYAMTWESLGSDICNTRRFSSNDAYGCKYLTELAVLGCIQPTGSTRMYRDLSLRTSGPK